jgi:uncharacterized protein with PIN domain
MADEKDRFGDKLKQREKAEEDLFFEQRDRDLLAKLRQKRAALDAKKPPSCPRCDQPLVAVEHQQVRVDECPSCHGVWLDKGELDLIAPHERESWLGRYFYRPKLGG